MGIVGFLLIALGGVAGFVGWIWLLVVAFQESVPWGLGSLLVPFVGLIFAFLHWAEAKRPFLVWVLGIVLAVAGAALGAIAAQPAATGV
jgi:hypothetical protein